MKKAVFMDRDGTIMKEISYPSDPEKVELLPNACSAIKLLARNGFKILIVSNQSGVGRGYFPIDIVYAVNERLLNLLKKEGGYIDKIYFCPHRPEDNCMCRKPKPGMINQAKEEFDIDLAHSYMIGDRSEDIELGNSESLRTILVLTGYGKYTFGVSNPGSKLNTLPETGEILTEYGIKMLRPVKPDFVAKDLLEAANWICRQK